jgi:hypothetical protein
MRRIVKACGERTRLIFVGDVDQLPPVGAGEPFFQLIHSGVVPVARLTVIHRQGKHSGIIVAAHGFNRGLVPDLSGYDDIEIEYVAGNAQLPARLLQRVGDLTARGLGVRCQRFALVAKDGKVTHVAVEAPGAFDVSKAEAVLAEL